ncbi:YdcH family protein [Vibrio hippocampi]|uniref:DUF465 domain-containing protein n=1 Tax=Vibrio hippocampi TaxID=654686 RepID=A0ABM8ZNB0_9VIBR|nr:YdcH family protein [Vibrio hippocampi]CAH0530055.1 hypothetical protein VHP8226_03783 [Vibrio hippocampi]
MLGEDHSLLHEFPEHTETIKSLIASDASFAEETKQYNALDKKIRVLELNNSPIDDGEMHKLKHERAVMKDVLLKKLVDVGE